jgi:hypothetical protein
LSSASTSSQQQPTEPGADGGTLVLSSALYTGMRDFHRPTNKDEYIFFSLYASYNKQSTKSHRMSDTMTLWTANSTEFAQWMDEMIRDLTSSISKLKVVGSTYTSNEMTLVDTLVKISHMKEWPETPFLVVPPLSI